MKTIRKNTFETNSSSTHAYTINASSQKPEFRPILDGDTTIKLARWGGDGKDNWKNKVRLLAEYLKITGSVDKISDLEKLITSHCGSPVFIDHSEMTVGVQENQDAVNANIQDRFSSFICEYHGHETVEEFRSAMDSILNTDSKTLAFIFSENQIACEEYYDG